MNNKKNKNRPKTERLRKEEGYEKALYEAS